MQKWKEQSSRVATYACSVIYNIAHSLRSAADLETSVLSKHITVVLQGLLETSSRGDAGENNLFESSALDTLPILRRLLPSMIERVEEEVLKMSVVSSDDQIQKTQVLGLLCIILYQALLRRVDIAAIARLADCILASLLEIVPSWPLGSWPMRSKRLCGTVSGSDSLCVCMCVSLFRGSSDLLPCDCPLKELS